MRARFPVASAVVLACLIGTSDRAVGAGAGDAADLAAARDLFERNLEAIRRRDRDAYLACYLDSDRLARTGPAGTELGFSSHAEQSRSSPWPDLFEALDLRLVPVAPGVVYGTYRYRVLYGTEEHSGLSERIFLRRDGGWRIAVTSAFDAPPGTPPPPRALVGATLIDGTGAAPIPDSVVLIRAGRIECAGGRSRCRIPDGVDRLDLTGRWITPGLIDAHVHFSQTGWADGRPDALDVRRKHPYEETQARLREQPEVRFRAYLCSGVTGVFDVGGYPWTWSLRERSESDSGAPRVAAAGPLLSTLDHWLNLPAEKQLLYIPDEKSARDGVAYLAAHRTSAVKIWLIVQPGADMAALESVVKAAGEEARARGVPLIVHATGLAEAKVALRAGARLLVHSVEDQPVDDEFVRLALSNRTIYCPTLTVGRGYLRMFSAAAASKAPDLDDPLGCTDEQTRARIAETAEYGRAIEPERLGRRAERVDRAEAVMAENLKKLHEAGVSIAMGTDAGNPLTMPGASVFAEMEAMQAAGLSPMEVLVAATRGGAEAMGRLEDLGTIEPGKWADLIVLDADPAASVSNLRRLRYVVKGGVVRVSGAASN